MTESGLLGFVFSDLPRAFPYLFLVGMKFSLILTVVSAILGLTFGILLAMCRLLPFPLISVPARIYVDGMRSVPLLLVIFWFYFLAPYIGAALTGSDTPIEVGAYPSAIITFSLFEAAYLCEIIRSGIGAIPPGQTNAAKALGLSSRQIMTSVILPQALRIMSPALLTRVIVLFQDTSLVYVVSLTDFFGAASDIGARDGKTVEYYIFAAVVYFVICATASRAVRRFAVVGSAR